MLERVMKEVLIHSWNWTVVSSSRWQSVLEKDTNLVSNGIKIDLSLG